MLKVPCAIHRLDSSYTEMFCHRTWIYSVAIKRIGSTYRTNGMHGTSASADLNNQPGII